MEAVGSPPSFKKERPSVKKKKSASFKQNLPSLLVKEQSPGSGKIIAYFQAQDVSHAMWSWFADPGVISGWFKHFTIHIANTE